MTMKTTTGGACAIFYTHREDNSPINKTTKKHPKNKSLCQKESANNQNEHVAKAMEHKAGALEVTKKVDHYKKIEKKRGYEGKSLKMDPRWVKALPKNDK